ncbi:hypothetical protein QQS21_003273 [Conoideocrella luteorostrata]|uniref:Cytochrome P450 n=1 Tax=Conoideocrella luteorostrata TaxID=1105319 RepID=A0AAJ0CXQ7_9HYPO|nr:hypothetical protein QQS21_003273 [Conoideocrella luteorostrata]
MHGFEWKNIRGVEGTGFVRALRHILTSKLADIFPTLRSHITVELRAQLLKHEVEPGSYRLPLYDAAKMLVGKTNCLVFFGQKLTADEDFLRAATRFPHECALAAEIIRFIPCKLSRWLAAKVTGNYKVASSFHRQLSREVSQRMSRFRLENQATINNDKRKTSTEGAGWDDGLQWLIETSLSKQTWDVDRMVGEVMGVWYGSVHTLGIGVTYALLDLYSRPEYVEIIRSELRDTPLESLSGKIDDLPVLDAFLKESARLSAFESTAVRRQALKPWTFTTGLSIQPGDWICVPTRSLMRDAARFPDPLRFDISRHRSTASSLGRDQTQQRLLVDSNKDNDGTLIWGLSRTTCPGRFYAATVMKLVVATFLEGYECELPPQCGARSLQWRSSIIPRSSIFLHVRDNWHGAAKTLG